MATVEKRSISLPTELANSIDAAVASGEYGNASEVVRDALRQWQERRSLFGYTVEQIQMLWDEGLNSGAARPLDADVISRIKKKGRQRVASRRNK